MLVVLYVREPHHQQESPLHCRFAEVRVNHSANPARGLYTNHAMRRAIESGAYVRILEPTKTAIVHLNWN